MCGIVGALSFSDGAPAVSAALVSRMRDAMAHRGPDSAGIWVDDRGRIALGHRRLAIVDLAASAGQPMSNEDGRLWVSFNGEIYNHPEIRAELERIGGHRWKTDHSDTEVILHAFEQWGIECLHRFRGMFAIALWDAGNRQLWLVRDRVGIKPLYYSLHDGRITFASEIKALLADPEQRRAVNEEAFYHYLSFLTTPAPETLFAGIEKLPAATWLRIDEDGRITRRRYWDVWDHAQPVNGMRDEEIAEAVLEELRTAVRLRKRADVVTGVFLSGGIDSGTNASLFAQGDGSRVKTFSIGYDRQYESCRDELYDAREMARWVGAEHHELKLTLDDLVNFLPQMVWHQDEPLADPVCVPLYYVSKLARDSGVIVCQVGEGADELFWGYPFWKTVLKLQRWSNLPLSRPLKHLGLWCLPKVGKGNGLGFEMLRRAAEGLPVFWSGAEAFTEGQKRRILGSRLRDRLSNLSSWEVLAPVRQRFERSAWSPDDLSWMTYADLNLRLPELLLMRIDKMSMAASLEGRVPFLDHKLVELVMSIPPEVKTRGGALKAILKKAVRGVIPAEVIHRPKRGFGVPVQEWFWDRLGDQIRAELGRFCRRTDFLDAKAVTELLAQRDRGAQAWYLFNFALWWKRFLG